VAIVAIYGAALPPSLLGLLWRLMRAADLFAVLCPGGPLRVLVELAQRRNERIPALIYSGKVGLSSYAQCAVLMARRPLRGAAGMMYEDVDAPDEQPLLSPPGEAIELQPLTRATAATAATDDDDDGGGTDDTTPALAASVEGPPADVDEDDEDDPGVQLGLGDFIFYSVMVARAALHDWTTVVAVATATVLVRHGALRQPGGVCRTLHAEVGPTGGRQGLGLTLLLLAVYRKALPALPISVALGITFYFGGRFALSLHLQAVAVAGIHL
jgi:presenilin 1